MKNLFLCAVLSGMAVMAHADVLRCVDAAGQVSYTDQRCPAGTRQVGQVATPPAAEPPRAHPVDPPERAALPPRAPVEAAAPPAAVPGGPIVFGSRPEARFEPQQREDERRRLEAERSAPPVLYPPGYPDPYADHGGRRRPPPPQDMRPRLRSCDATGCEDRLGNHYTPGGKVDRYVRPDGRTCRPVGSTVVCN